jgi:hypothetical protein
MRVFGTVQVRAHAVEVLQKTEDEELLYYLLQLVQVRHAAGLCLHFIGGLCTKRRPLSAGLGHGLLDTSCPGVGDAGKTLPGAARMNGAAALPVSCRRGDKEGPTAGLI